MNHMKRTLTPFISITIFLFLLLPPLERVYASNRLPFNRKVKAQIEETFYSEGFPHWKKINAYYTRMYKRYGEVRKNLVNYYSTKMGLGVKAARKKSKKKGDVESYRLLLKLIRELRKISSEDTVTFDRLAWRVLEMDYALKVEGKKLPSYMLFEKVPASLKPRKIPIHAAPRGEATNLVNPSTGAFFTQKELIEYKRQGGDVSQLNPPLYSTYWARQDISGLDVREHYQNGRDPVHHGLEIRFPKGKAYFDKIRKTQTKPKIDINIPGSGGGELDFKLKIGAEVHSEITSSALYSLLGFSVDISLYVRDFKVVLGDVPFHEFRREWESYYSRYSLDKFIKERGEDGEGHYIIFHEGVLEAKPKGLMRIGPWSYGNLGHPDLREVRGSLLFHMWVANLDLKEAENNKMIVRKVGKWYRFYHIAHDMGFAFGDTYIERVGSFSWKLVKKKTDSHVRMNYRCFQRNSIFKHVTFADARWMARLIARLTRKQIEDAVTLGGWPESIGRLLVEKLIARRNQMVTVFNLEGEKLPDAGTIQLIKYDRYLTTHDGVVVKGKLKIYEFPGYPQYFGPRINELILLLIKGLRNTFIDSVVRMTGAIKYIKIDPEWFGLDEGIIAYGIMRMNREIEANPTPRNESETFLVKDSVELGFRLGYGYVLSGEVAYIRKYTLVYPVESRDKGRFYNGFILNVFLPARHRKQQLPKKHVIIVEDYLEGRGKLRLRGHHDFTPQVQLTGAKVFLDRRFLSRKGRDKIVYFRDRSLYDQLAVKAFFEIAELFRITFFDAFNRKGKLNRTFVEMDTADLENNTAKQEALDLLLTRSDSTAMERLGRVQRLSDRFRETGSKLDLLGFFRKRSVFRLDRVKVKTGSAAGIRAGLAERQHVQVESRKVDSWSFLDNGERHFSSVRLIGSTRGGEDIRRPLLFLSFRVNDNSTADGELKKWYLPFINRVAGQKHFIDFDPTTHTVNRLWGNTQLFMDMTVFEEGLERMLRTTGGTIWSYLARETGKDESYWRGLLDRPRRRGRPVAGKYSRDRYLAFKTRFLVRLIKRAREAGGGAKRMVLVVRALRKAIFKDGHTFSPVLLAVLHRVFGKENVRLTATVTMPENKELVYPARTPFYNETGREETADVPVFKFIFEDPSEIYHLF